MHQRAHLEQREKEQDAQRDNAEGSEPPVQISFKGIVLHGSLRRLKISVGLFAFCGCAAVGQQRFALDEEQGQRGKAGDHVGHRLGNIDAQHIAAHDNRQQQCQGHQQHHFAQQRQEQADLGLAKRHKGGLAGHLRAEGPNAAEENGHHFFNDFYQLRVLSEHARQHAGKERGQGKARDGNEQHYLEQQAESFAHAAVILGAVVVAHNGLRALCDALDGHDEHLHHALHNGHAAHVQVAAVALQPGVQRDIHKALGALHDERSDAQPDDLANHTLFELHVPAPDADAAFCAEQKAQHPRGADGLRKDGSQRRAGNAHAEHENKHRVQHDVNDRADEHAEHCNGGVALCADESVEAQSKLYENSTRQVNGDIVLRIADDGVGGAEHIQQRRFEDAENDCQCNRQHQKHGKAVAQNFFRTFTVAGAQLDGSQRRAAHSGECGKGRDQQDDGERNAHSRQRKCACAGDVADVDPVHDIVQHVDELRGNGRQGKTEHQLANGLCAQRFVLVLQKNLSFLTLWSNPASGRSGSFVNFQYIFIIACAAKERNRMVPFPHLLQPARARVAQC